MRQIGFPGAVMIGLMGPPGAGKGTQAKLLEDEFGFRHLSTGDLLRGQIAAGTELGRKAREIINGGHLMPDAVINGMMSEPMGETLATGGRLMLDGYPRTEGQLAHVLGTLDASAAPKVFGVFFLDVPLEKLMDRLEGRRVCAGCGAVYNIHYLPAEKPGYCDVCGGELVQRPDDKRESVRERLTLYERETCPVRNALEATGHLIRIPAENAHELVHREIVRELQALLRRAQAKLD